MPVSQVRKYANVYRSALIENPDDTELNNSAAMCYLKLKLYDKALEKFERAMEDNLERADIFFYAAICLLKGKKAFLAERTDIDKAEKFIQAALMIEPKGIYYYFWAYIKYDYFYRKCYKTFPTYQEAFAMAQQKGLSNYDVNQLYDILGVEHPDCL